MSNGANTWGVSYAQIVWFQNLLIGHQNVEPGASRSQDILFTIQRHKQEDELRVLCCNEYVMGQTAVQRAIAEFPSPNIIYVGGTWCKYTKQAKDYCLQNRIGLYNSGEMSGALWANDFWAYHKRDKDGDPVYFFGTE